MKLFFLFSAVLALSHGALGGTLSIQIEGDGYLRFVKDGKMVYAKSSDLVVVNGRLGTGDGAILVPAIAVADATNLSVDLEGNVTSLGKSVGRIVLALFESALAPAGSTGFSTSAARPRLGNPGEGTNGVVRANSSVPKKPGQKETKVADTDETAPEAETGQRPTGPKVKASLGTDIPAKPKTAVESTSVQVTISDKVEVESDTITLGAIAKIAAPKALLDRLARIELGDTPLLVVERIVDRSRILSRIKAAGIDPDTVSLVGPDKIRVSRKGQTVSHAQFVESAVRGAQLKGYGALLESLTPGPEMKVPVGELELVCESVNGSNADLNAIVGVYVDGKRFNSRTVRLKSTALSMNLKVGTPVTVRVKSGSVSVESKGKVVRVDPSTGTVTVLVTDTGAVVSGTLAADGAVEVKA